MSDRTELVHTRLKDNVEILHGRYILLDNNTKWKVIGTYIGFDKILHYRVAKHGAESLVDSIASSLGRGHRLFLWNSPKISFITPHQSILLGTPKLTDHLKVCPYCKHLLHTTAKTQDFVYLTCYVCDYTDTEPCEKLF